MKQLILALILVCLSATVQAQSVLLYEQPPDPAGGVATSSWFPPDGSDADSWAYDSFILDATGPVTEVRWRGGYSWSGAAPVTNFIISFYATNITGNEPDCGLPGEHDLHLARYDVGGTANQSYAGVFGGITMYDYSYQLPQPFQATGGEKYWIQLLGETSGIPFWGPSFATGGNGSHVRFYNHIFNFWPHDTAFSLYGTAAPTYTITTAVDPVGTGITTGDGEYPPDSQCTVVAIGNAGWTFLNWTENGAPVSNSASYTFTVTGDRDLVAHFATAYTITSSAQPYIGGTTDGDGIYAAGSQVTVAALEAPYWQFVQWTESGVPVSSSPEYTFVATGNRTLVAWFALVPGAALFDFNNAPLYANLPIDQTSGGLTAHFSVPGIYGFYVQYANFPPTTPDGFSGLCLYPDSFWSDDLTVDFDVPIRDFSLMFAPQEYNCDDSATLRATAYLGGVYVGTNTAVVSQPGTWPSGTLTFSAAEDFDRVVVTYDADPPICQDFIRTYMVDNLIVVVPAGPTAVAEHGTGIPLASVASPNPFGAETTIRFGVRRPGPISVAVYDPSGRLVRTLASEARAEAGSRSVRWDGRDDSGRRLASGVYLCRIAAGGETASQRLMLVRSR